MPKYTEAFFNITHKPVTIMQIRNEYNLDHTVYERRYKGHIFCPYVIKDVEKIGGDIEKQAVSQLDMLLRSMVDNN